MSILSVIDGFVHECRILIAPGFLGVYLQTCSRRDSPRIHQASGFWNLDSPRADAVGIPIDCADFRFIPFPIDFGPLKGFLHS